MDVTMWGFIRYPTELEIGSFSTNLWEKGETEESRRYNNKTSSETIDSISSSSGPLKFAREF